MRPKRNPDAAGRGSLWRLSAWLVPATLLIVLCAAFWPANLGGRTIFVSTHGTSMEPRFHSGDLAIVQPSSEYRVGTIAAYKSATLNGAVVLHRIRAIDHGRFTFKGDNNNFTDPDHPSAAAIVGALRARVPHGGEIRAALAQPRVWLPLLALVLVGVIFIPRKRSRRRASSTGSPHLAGPSPGFTAAALAVCCALVITGAVWLAPRTQTAHVAQQYRQNAKLGYSATTRPGAVYADGRVRTGDPVFTRMVPAVTIDLHYAFATSSALHHTVRGTSQIVADVSSTPSWHREIALNSVRTFVGDRLHRTATLDLRALRGIQRAFTAETGVDSSATSVSVIGKVHVAGSAKGSTIATDLTPKLNFTLTPVELIPTMPASGGAAAGDASVTKTGSVMQPVVRPRPFGLGPIQIPGDLARRLSLMLLVAAIAVFALSIARARRRPVRDEGARIVARYRHLLVTADAIPALHRHPVVRVDSMRDLARLAKFHDELVVHADESGAHHFALFTDPVVYVFEIGTPVDAAASPLELAQWALAGLEAHAAKRRHQALRVPLRRHARAVPDKTVPDKVVQNTVVQNPVAPDNAAPDTLLPGKSASGVEVTADSTR